MQARRRSVDAMHTKILDVVIRYNCTVISSRYRVALTLFVTAA
jgi:hypothetical protein